MTDDARATILHLVETYPGLHLREIQRRAKLSAMLTEYHLNVLEKLELVHSVQHGRYRDFFPRRGPVLALSRTDKVWLGLLRRPPVLSISLHLLDSGIEAPLAIARALRQPNSTTVYQLKVMVEAGLAAFVEDGAGRKARLSDPERVLQLVQSYHPTPDLVTKYATAWQRVLNLQAPASARLEAPSDEELAKLSPACQAIFAAIGDVSLTQKELCRVTELARRTVYGGLQQLEAAGLVESHVDLRDTRQRLFRRADKSGQTNPQT